jgi:TonB family protein
MKKMFVLLAMFCLCFQAVAVYAATTPDFSGVWELDVSKSILPETMRLESMILIVSQTEKELEVESSTKLNRDDNAGMVRNMPFQQTAVYNLEGKEMTTSNGHAVPTINQVRKAAVMADGKLNLTTILNFGNEQKSTLKTNEIWELLDPGKTLKIIRYTETLRGAVNAEMFFTYKSPETKTRGIKKRVIETGENSAGKTPSENGAGEMPKKISGGVLNGKATSLPKPEYPEAARAVKASGAVNVQVTIGEQGNIISASAVSGHPLLRQAAEEAARNAKFAPTSLSGVPVKVTGVLVYNFVP